MLQYSFEVLSSSISTENYFVLILSLGKSLISNISSLKLCLFLCGLMYSQVLKYLTSDTIFKMYLECQL